MVAGDSTLLVRRVHREEARYALTTNNPVCDSSTQLGFRFTGCTSRGAASINPF